MEKELKYDGENFEELVDLFLSGKASETEKDLLFSQIATDPSLRDSLQQSAVMKTAVQHEVSRTSASSGHKRKVFLAAGLFLPEVASSATHGLMQTLLGSKYILATFSLLVGVLSASSFFLLSEGGIDDPTITANNLNIENLERGFSEVEPIVMKLEKPLASNTFYSNNTESADYPRSSSYSANHSAEQESIQSISTVSSINAGTQESAAGHNIAIVSPSSRALAEGWNSNLLIEPSNRLSNKYRESVIMQQPDMAGIAMVELSERPRGVSDFFDENLNGYHVTLFGVNSMLFFDQLAAENGTVPYYGNLGLSLEYDIVENGRLLLTYADEKMPIFRLQDNGAGFDTIPEQTIQWLGVGYRHYIQNLALGYGIVPFAQLTLGSTAYGFLAKPAFGLSYTPERRVSMAAAVDATGISLRSSKGTQFTGKMGVVFLLTYNF